MKLPRWIAETLGIPLKSEHLAPPTQEPLKPRKGLRCCSCNVEIRRGDRFKVILVKHQECTDTKLAWKNGLGK